MASLIWTLILSAVMGLSIYMSLPIVLRKKTADKTKKLLSAIAIGILVFLIADVFSNAAPSLYNGSLNGFGTNPLYSVVFALSLAVGFFMLYYFENLSGRNMTPTMMSLMIASGIGLQNLTEGLVFGASATSLGLFSGVTFVILVGFILQNTTEGFPIASPFLNDDDKKLGTMLIIFLVGGLPTILGGAIGYFYSSTLFNMVFDGLAIGSILYVILPMTKHLLKDIDPIRQKLVYAGIFLGFLIGFLVNLI